MYQNEKPIKRRYSGNEWLLLLAKTSNNYQITENFSFFWGGDAGTGNDLIKTMITTELNYNSSYIHISMVLINAWNKVYQSKCNTVVK